MMVGDFNVAPLECDVWSHKALLDVVSHTPIEVETLARLQAGARLGRPRPPFHPRARRALYTWWSYRAQDWAANDRGRRLDHMWATPDLAGSGDRAPGRRAVPQLGAAVRPCAAGHGVCLLSDAGAAGSTRDRRAAARLAGARSDGDGTLDLLAIETARDASVWPSSIRSDAPLLISGERAVTLKLANQRDAADAGRPVLIERVPLARSRSRRPAIADPALDLADAAQGPVPHAIPVGEAAAAGAALTLARLRGPAARLLRRASRRSH